MAQKSKAKASSKTPRSHGQGWSKDDVKQMKSLIKQNTPTRLIAMKMNRTEGSIRNKVQREGLSLAPTNRSPRD